MDYEKAYKETLERAKKRFNANPTDGYVGYSNEILKEIFPELTESEDERIYNLIHSSIKFGEPIAPPKNKELALAYLEKQKEQDKCPEYCVRSHCIGCSIYEKHNPTLEYYLKATPAERRKMSMTEILEKEQNPTEWSEREKRLMKALQITNARMAELVEENYNLKEQKQEWSEEDEKNFKWFDKLFRAESVVVGGRDIPQDKYLWFKSLHPYWKPSEEQPLTIKQVVEQCKKFGGNPEVIQQERPEVDLEKEIKNYLATKCAGDDEPSVSEIAHHFYELGLNARKEE